VREKEGTIEAIKTTEDVCVLYIFSYPATLRGTHMCAYIHIHAMRYTNKAENDKEENLPLSFSFSIVCV